MQEITDLRPAPRTTPKAVLGLMAAVAVAGSGLLLFVPPPETRTAASDAAPWTASSAASATAAPVRLRPEPPLSLHALRVP
jgi:hypothetical protein